MSVQITAKTLTSAESVESIDDLLVEIFLKLPLRSLFRCKFVSTRWHSIIVNRVLLLLNRIPNAAAVGLSLPTGYDVYKYLQLDLKTTKHPPFTEKLHLKDHPAWPFWIHQSCNGLLLCCSSCDSSKPCFGRSNNPIRCCYVYNPTTKAFACLPRPGACDGVPRMVFSVNLAFDLCKSPFYKAVCVKGSRLAVDLLEFEVYSVEFNAWRSSGKPFRYKHEDFCNGVFWNGSIHWINLVAREILFFNVDEETLRKISLPDDLTYRYNRVGYFGESCGHLHLISAIETSSFSVYEMKRDYSEWFVQYRVDTSLVYAETRLHSVLCLTHGPEGSFLFMLMSDSVVIRYDLVSESFTEVFLIGHDEFAMLSSGFDTFEYIESVARV